MNFLKDIAALYISSSIHVALAVVSLSWVSFIRFNLSPDYGLLLFIFFGSITGYNFVKYAGIAKLHHLSLTRNLRFIQVFSLFCFLASVYMLLQQSMEVVMLSGVFGLFTLLYAIPFWKGKFNLRSLNGAKVFVIALVWAGTTVFLPLKQLEFLDSAVIIEFLQRFILVVVLMLPFEIRDLKYDLLKLGTIPQQLGVPKTKKLGYMLLLVVIIWEALRQPFISENFIPVILMVVTTAGFLYKSNVSQSPFFASFWVEGIPVLWLGYALIIGSLF